MEWVRGQWSSAEAESVRLQSELDEALRTLSKWEAKFAHVRKLLDGEKRERNIVLKKYSELVSLFYDQITLAWARQSLKYFIHLNHKDFFEHLLLKLLL